MDLKKYPNLQLPQLKFLATKAAASKQKEAVCQLQELIEHDCALPIYEEYWADLRLPLDDSVRTKMENSIRQTLQQLEDKLEDAKTNLGETEIFEALQEVAMFHARIGNKEKCISAFRIAYEKAVAIGTRLELVLVQIRVGFFFEDSDLITRNIEKAKSLLEEGGDWERRNRLRVYEGLHLFTKRQFRAAADLLVESLSTFSAEELMSYKEFIKFSVLAAMLSFKRIDLQKKIVESPEVLQVVHEIPFLNDFLQSFYGCDYALFFRSLAEMEILMKQDRFIFPISGFIVKEMKILGYSQLLQSYRSLTLEFMARAFGVSVEFIEAYEASKFK